MVAGTRLWHRWHCHFHRLGRGGEGGAAVVDVDSVGGGELTGSELGEGDVAVDVSPV